MTGKLFTYGHNGFGQLGAGRPSLRKYNCAFEGWSEVLTPFRIASVAASHYNLFASVVSSPDAGKSSLLRILETEQHTECVACVPTHTHTQTRLRAYTPYAYSHTRLSVRQHHVRGGRPAHPRAPRHALGPLPAPLREARRHRRARRRRVRSRSVLASRSVLSARPT